MFNDRQYVDKISKTFLNNIRRITSLKVSIAPKYFNSEFDYEWTKRTKFLLVVIYRSPRRHSSSSKTFKKSENIDTKFYDHFRDNWIIWDDEPARPWRSLTTYFSKSIRDREVKFWKHHQSILQFVILKFDINIFDSLETMRSSAT